MKVLVADDNPVGRKLLQEVIAAESWEVKTCATGREALQLLRQEFFDLVISDILMPEMDGYELCHAVRQEESCSDVALIFYSGTYLSADDWKFGMQAGADEFLSKDVSPKHLVVVARDLLQRTPAERKVLRGQLLAQPDFALQHRERLRRKLSEKDADLTRQTEELRDLETRLAVWLATSSAVIYTLEIRGNELVPKWVSPNIKEFTGFESGEACRPGWWRERVHPDDLPRLNFSCELWNKRLAMTHEYQFLRRDGVYFWVRDEQRFLRDSSGKPLEIVGVLTDITDQKRTERVLKESAEQLRMLSARLERIREEEATRIAREIHDELGQALTSLNMDVCWVQARAMKINDGDLRQAFHERAQSMGQILSATIQTVQRIASELRPSLLDDVGLLAALESHAEDFSRRSGLQICWAAKYPTPLLSKAAGTAIFRIFQEALTNVARHAAATTVTLALTQSDQFSVLEISDNGRGFSDERQHNPKSLGLLGMRERAQMAGGSIEIVGGPAEGATVRVRMPLVPK